ncbi:MAG: U32 family peptidase [Oscillospiraceae bacterium]|nr:U32 family peptidase [Oscillospiraceae bacterium]
MSVEILAPAGSMESVYAAVRCGADAVYVGGDKYSARANATNFTASQLQEAVNYCHLHNVKVYQALNTLLFDSELEEFAKTAVRSAEMGIDAFIVQDLGAARLIREILPDMKMNASTQMTIHTKEGALLAKERGFSRVVLSRELSLEQIREITSAGIEVEAFVHGALCMSVSGQCYMSAMIGSRSADRGLCAQACRLPFSAVKGQDRYDLSLKDMSHVKHIKALEEAGVCSLKIEGRMKRAEYVAAAVSACRAAADGKEPDIERLKAVFSRSGFTDGYFKGTLGKDMFGTRQKEDVVSAESVLPELRELYRKETKAVKADITAVIKQGEPVKVEMTADGISVSVNGEQPQTALNRPTDMAVLEKQLSKLGDTPYELGNITAEIDEGVMVPASQLNALRREAVEKLDNVRIEIKKKTHTVKSADFNFIKKLNLKRREIRVQLSYISQLDGVGENAEMIFLPIDELLKHNDVNDERLAAVLPRFVINEKALGEKLEKLKDMGINRVMCTNYGQFRLCRDKGIEIYGGYGLNVTNSYSMMELAELGAADCTVSFEMKLHQVNTLGDYLPYGIIAYGRLPLMLTRNCPVKQAVGSCKSCTGGLTDRTGRFFPVKCDGVSCEVLNSDVLVMSDKLHEIDTDFILLCFTDESAERVKEVIDAYRNGTKLDGELTRGLYYRGII